MEGVQDVGPPTWPPTNKTRASQVTEHGPIPRDQWEAIAESIRHDLGDR